jgi:hypothetical protein
MLALTCNGFAQNTGQEVVKFRYRLPTQDSSRLVVDTLLSGSQIHHPFFKTFGSWSELGNTGLPALINQYRPVRKAINPILFEGFDGYGLSSTELDFYSAKSPFSLLNYNSGGTSDKNGQTISALFAKNLKNNGNISVMGDYFNSDGHFSKQKGNASRMYINYILNRKNYSLITGVSRFSFGFAENGGIKEDEKLATTQASFLPVNLSGAASKASILAIQGVQTAVFYPGRKKPVQILPDSVAAADSAALPNLAAADSLYVPDSLLTGKEFGKPLKIMHQFRLRDIQRRYSDVAADAGFYTNTYSENKITKDSVRFLTFTNDICAVYDSVRIGRFPMNLKGGISPDVYRYLRADSVNYGFSLGLNGAMSLKVNSFGVDVSGRWDAAGFTSGDYDLQAGVSLLPNGKKTVPIVRLEFKARGSSPDPMIRNYTSNHFTWTNDFLRQHETGITGLVEFPSRKASISAGLVTNTNRIYFDTLGLPAQLQGSMAVYFAKGTKEFRAGPLRSTITALVQYTGSDAIRLPLFAGSASTFMHHDIHFKLTGGELQIEYGFDLYYNTAFYGYGYMPATGAFINEDVKVLGNYPLLNVFGQMKVKRTRVFVAWCQTFADMLPQQSFAVLHYPSMRPHLKYGLYWHFYD